MGKLELYSDQVRAAVGRFPPGRQASAVVELLYLAQAAYGHLTKEAIAEVADLLGIEATRVGGLVGFYSLLMDVPHGGWVVHYCTDLPCALRGAHQLLPVLADRLGTPVGSTSQDGLFSLRTAMCLGACHRAPVMQVNLEYFYDLTPQQIDEIVSDLRRRSRGNPPRRPPFGLGPPSQVPYPDGGDG